MSVDEVQELPSLFELLLIDLRAAHKIRDRVLKIFGNLDLVDIEYNSNSDCLEFIFSVEVASTEDMLKLAREDNTKEDD